MKSLRFKLLLLVAVSQIAASAEADEIRSAGKRGVQLRIEKGTVPSDESYLKFMQWHEQQSVLEAVVSTDDRDEVSRVLEKLVDLKQRGVLIGALTVVGRENFDLLTPADGIEVLSRERLERTVSRSMGRLMSIDSTLYGKYVSLLQHRQKASALASRLALGSPQSANADELIEKYHLTHSPAWIVRHRGKEYIYQGKIEPRQLFTADGAFRGAESIIGDAAEEMARRSRVRFARPQPDRRQFASRFTFRLPHGAGTYDGKPDCTTSRVRQRPVIVDSAKLRLFDLLVYNYRDPKQSDSADRWEFPTVPYLEGALVNPIQPARPQQYWARFFDIQCLPTRVHYRTVNGAKVEEYREGERAFDRQY